MDGDNVLARKIGLKGVGRSPIPDIERLGELIAKEMEGALRPILSAQVAAMVMESEIANLSVVLESLPAPSLVTTLGFPGAKYKAMTNLDAELVFHIVDLRMGGDPAICPIPTARSLTAIDYALNEDVVKAITFAVETAIETQLDGPLDNHFEIKDKAQNVGNVTVANDNADVLRFTISLDIGVAARAGDLDIVIPLSVLDLVRSSVRPNRAENTVAVRDIWLERMRRAVTEAELPLTAVLATPQIPTQKLKTLKAGDVIPISGKAPQNIALTLGAGTRDQFVVTHGQLGAFEGSKVLKLNASANPNLVRHIVDAVAEDKTGG